jgi:hypothetical protein
MSDENLKSCTRPRSRGTSVVVKVSFEFSALLCLLIETLPRQLTVQMIESNLPSASRLRLALFHVAMNLTPNQEFLRIEFVIARGSRLSLAHGR